MRVSELVEGVEFGPTAWKLVDQARIVAFADATDDHQWIHIDGERASGGRFGVTIAHGFLTLSLLSSFVEEVVPIESELTINYGLDRVRFPAPLPSGSRVRGTFRVGAVSSVGESVQVKLLSTVEREGHEKPVCVAELILRFSDPH